MRSVVQRCGAESCVAHLTGKAKVKFHVTASYGFFVEFRGHTPFTPYFVV